MFEDGKLPMVSPKKMKKRRKRSVSVMHGNSPSIYMNINKPTSFLSPIPKNMFDTEEFSTRKPFKKYSRKPGKSKSTAFNVKNKWKGDSAVTDKNFKIEKLLYVEIKEKLEKEKGRNKILKNENGTIKKQLEEIKKKMSEKDEKLRRLVMDNIRLTDKIENKEIPRKEKEIKIMSKYLDEERFNIDIEKSEMEKKITEFIVENMNLRDDLRSLTNKKKSLEIEVKKLESEKNDAQRQRDENYIQLKQSKEEFEKMKKRAKFYLEKKVLFEKELEKNSFITQKLIGLKDDPEFQPLLRKLNLIK